LTGFERNHAPEGPRQGGFAAPHRTNNGHQFSRLDAETEPVQSVLRSTLVPNDQVTGLKASPALVRPTWLSWTWIWWIFDFRLALE
jgi:hypothetical protein